MYQPAQDLGILKWTFSNKTLFYNGLVIFGALL
jgi:hypothetical protein